MSDPFRALLLVPEVKTRLAELVSALCNPATRRLPTYWALRYLALVLTFRCLFSPPSLFCIKKIFAQSDSLVSFPEKNPVVVLMDPERVVQLIDLVPWITDSAWCAWIWWTDKMTGYLTVFKYDRVH